MALVKCGECGNQVSDKAPACPNCGAPVSEQGEKFTEEEELFRARARLRAEEIARNELREEAAKRKLEAWNRKLGMGCLGVCVVFVAIFVSVLTTTNNSEFDRCREEQEMYCANRKGAVVGYSRCVEVLVKSKCEERARPPTGQRPAKTDQRPAIYGLPDLDESAFPGVHSAWAKCQASYADRFGLSACMSGEGFDRWVRMEVHRRSKEPLTLKSARTASFTVREYEIYRAVINTPMSVSDAQAFRNAARRYGVTVNEVEMAVNKVQSILDRNNWFGSPESEIRHAFDWRAE